MGLLSSINNKGQIMEQKEIQELTETTYALITILKDMLWAFEYENKSANRRFNGLLALIDTIEQNAYNIKVSFECL